MAEPAPVLVIVLWMAGPDRPRQVAAPFVYALAARALDSEVEIHYTAECVRWLVPGVAEHAYTDRAQTKTVLDFIRETKAAGVRHYACAMALAEHAGDRELIPEADGVAGAVTVVAQTLSGSATLVF